MTDAAGTSRSPCRTMESYAHTRPVITMTHQPAFAEFFAGIGLVRLALEQAGWRCVFANDIDPKKATIYRQNFPADELVVSDIFTLDIADIPREADLWTASFPCIDLSLAGNRAGLDGAHSGAFWGFMRLLRAAHAEGRGPSRVLLENVVGFATSGGGADLAAALSAVADLGYRSDVLVVDARHFTAQSRPRLFVVAELATVSEPVVRPERATWRQPALRPAAIERFMARYPDLSWGALDLHDLPWQGPPLASIIEPLAAAAPAWWPDEAVERLLAAMTAANRARLGAMLARPTAEYGTVYRRVRGGVTRPELRWDGLAGCLRTPRGGSSKQFLLVTEGGRVRVRHLTVRECARLQGVPDDFRFDVPANQAWFGLGDAVCVPVVRWLVSHLPCAGSGQPSERRALALAG